MARIYALPEKIKKLALANQKANQIAAEIEVEEKDDYLSNAFIWSETPEGNDFWNIISGLY